MSEEAAKLWGVAKIRSGAEEAMHDVCREIGVESECPMVRQKGPRRRTDGTREAIVRPALTGYLCMTKDTVEAPETRERLYQEPSFYDFLRDPANAIAWMFDHELNPLRAMEKSEPVKFYSGPSFFLGEIVKVPYNSPHVLKAFWGMTGQVVSVKNGRYCLALRDNVSERTLETWFAGYQLLANS